MKTKVFLLTLLIFLVGCSSNQSESPTNSMGDMSGHTMPASTDQSGELSSVSASENKTSETTQKQYKLEATLQQEGNQYSILVNTDLTLSKEHYNQKHQYGEGHIHLYVDGKLKGPVLENGPFKLDGALLNGEKNEIKLVLAGNDHSEPYNASVELEIAKASSN